MSCLFLKVGQAVISGSERLQSIADNPCNTYIEYHIKISLSSVNRYGASSYIFFSKKLAIYLEKNKTL